jgi:hypothetical protein
MSQDFIGTILFHKNTRKRVSVFNTNVSSAPFSNRRASLTVTGKAKLESTSQEKLAQSTRAQLLWDKLRQHVVILYFNTMYIKIHVKV